MIRNAGLLIFSVSLISALSGCVSVSLPSMDGKRAQEVRFTAPSSPFKSLKTDSGDGAWISTRTGNTISYVSDCAAKIDPELDQILDDSAQILEKPEVSNRASLNYNGRAAKTALVNGSLDGIPVRLKLLVFKKNDCSYTLSYTAKPSTFDTEAASFEAFLSDFKAP